MSAANLPETSAEIIGQLEVLYRETRETDNVDEDLFRRINEVVIKMQVTICHYEKTPLLLKTLNPQIDENFQHLKDMKNGTKAYNVSFILAKIKKIFKSLSLLNVDSELAKAIADADISLIEQKVNSFLSANALKDEEVNLMKNDLINHFINQNKLKEAWELGKALFSNNYALMTNQFIESNRLVEAIPYIITQKNPPLELLKGITTSYTNYFLLNSKGYPPSGQREALVQAMINAGADPSSGVHWGPILVHNDSRLIGGSPQEFLQELIFNGANIKTIKADITAFWQNSDLALGELPPMIDRARMVYEEVSKTMEDERAKQAAKFHSEQLITAESDFPKDLWKVILDYTLDRGELVRRCKVRMAEPRK